MPQRHPTISTIFLKGGIGPIKKIKKRPVLSHHFAMPHPLTYIGGTRSVVWVEFIALWAIVTKNINIAIFFES